MRKKLLVFTTAILLSITIICSAVFADWYKDNDRYKYFNSATGQYVVNNWLQTGNGFYYFDTYGYAVTGWYLINGKYYYFDQNGLMQIGFVEANGKKYYLNPSDGQMVTGWIQTYDNGVLDYYYFGDDGVMYTGWNKIGDAWFYFYNGKCLVNTFAEVNGTWYHFAVNGAMDTGWVNANGKMFYFNARNGSLTKGWIQDQNGNEYYLSEVDGSLAVNTTIQIGGTYYTFDSLGRCVNKNDNMFIGSLDGNTNYVTSGSGVLGIQGTESVYGVNIGVSPGSGAGFGGITSFQQEYNQSQPLQSGLTTGPK